MSIAKLLPVVLVLLAAGLLTGCGKTQYMYTVQEGDASLADVAEKVYGDAAHAGKIAEANPGMDAAALKPGTQLVVPVLKTEAGEMITPMECDRKRVY
jgi:hypothetical protein